ncbi:hypothetical protein [Streptococcus sp. CSL10205-OR2]|uniref:hypothetical protein n=1 Tax=Streptococcus sp. CSL10205-OR2 TaxID=2980558 RepID=UPI0021D83D27|nr:hypothetical protein [Streptococcus sp. CSL10205-OR2]MCU9533704.1 hypothetical protein [Streptococcus sp. CSL10205-OR2]
MKKVWLFLLAIFSIVLVACQSQPEPKEISQPYDFAIFDEDKIVTFKQEGDSASVVESVARKNQLQFNKENTAQSDASFFAVSLQNGKTVEPTIISVQRDDLTEKIHTLGTTFPYTIASDGTYLYSVTLDEGIRLVKYDKDFNEIENKRLIDNDFVNMANQLLVVDDSLYLLMSSVSNDTSMPSTQIWKLSKSFDIEEKINIEEPGVYVKMVNVGRTLYLLDRSSGDYASQGPLLTYQLDTKEKSYVEITTPLLHPVFIDYEPNRNELLIATENGKWLTYQLETHGEKISEFSTVYDDIVVPFFAKTPTHQYFLFHKTLFILNVETNYSEIIYLQEFDIKLAHALVINSEND